ncbi:MAG: amino acid ABC transporter permease [Acidimicrobiales bacterium]
MSSLFTWAGYLPDLVDGLWVALRLTGFSLLFGYPLGLLFALGIGSRLAVIRWVTLVLVELGRGMPLLVLLFIVYQGLPQAGLVFGPMVSAVLAFTFSAAAYSTEILRSSLGAVSPGQAEAAAAAGMSNTDSFRFIILPQAIRVALPPLLSLAIQMFQLSSLAYLVTVPEVMQAARFRSAVTFDALSVFVAAAVLYASITIPASFLVDRLEARLSRHL